MLKKIFIIFILLMISNVYLSASTKTGHDGINKVDFKEGGLLLIDMSKSTLDDAYNIGTNRMAFGWYTHYFNINIPISYTGETIFSKGNNTSTAFTFNYYLKEVETSERSVNVTGSIAAKAKGKIKGVDLQLDGQIEKKIGTKDTITKTEETTLNIKIQPQTKITLRIIGEGTLTNGVSSYFFLGIRFKKGSWEYIDIETKFYELVEEVY